MTDFNELRRLDDEEEELGFDFDADVDDNIIFDESESGRGELFLGMTPVERMFISIFLFMNVLVLGLALLLATNRIRF